MPPYCLLALTIAAVAAIYENSGDNGIAAAGVRYDSTTAPARRGAEPAIRCASNSYGGVRPAEHVRGALGKGEIINIVVVVTTEETVIAAAGDDNTRGVDIGVDAITGEENYGRARWYSS